MKTKTILNLIAAALMLLVAGCTTSRYQVQPIIKTDKPYAVSWTTEKLKDNIGFDRRKMNREFINPYTYNPAAPRSGQLINDPINSLYAIAVDVKNTNLTQRVQARNELQNAILRVSDDVTSRHLAQLKSTENDPNLFLGAATIGLSGGASVASEAAGKALAAAATGTAGAREMFNEQVFRNALGESIIAAIESDRRKFFTETIQPEQTKSITDYDVEAAIRDANVYHELGSFYHGLALVRQDAEKANTKRLDEAAQKRANNPAEIEQLKLNISQLIESNTNNLATFTNWVADSKNVANVSGAAKTNITRFLLTQPANTKSVLDSLLKELLAK